MSNTTKRSAPNPSEAGFTLTELVAGLLVASMLLTGIVELTRRYATTSVRMQTASEEIADIRVLDAMMRSVERVDPGTLDISGVYLSGKIGGSDLRIEIRHIQSEKSQITWSGPGVERTLEVGGKLEFRSDKPGSVLLVTEGSQPPLVSVRAMRDAPFDCRFDTVSRTCR